jgi:hypothetical protein
MAGLALPVSVVHHSPAVYWGTALAWSHKWTIYLVLVLLMLPAHAALILVTAWLLGLHVRCISGI